MPAGGAPLRNTDAYVRDLVAGGSVLVRWQHLIYRAYVRDLVAGGGVLVRWEHLICARARAHRERGVGRSSAQQPLAWRWPPVEASRLLERFGGLVWFQTIELKLFGTNWSLSKPN